MTTIRAALAELIGAFAVVLVAAGASIAAGFGLDPVGVALAYGSATGAVVWVTSGRAVGMVNPAIAIGAWVVGRIPTVAAAVAVAAQAVGAVAAAFLLRYVVPSTAFDAALGGTPATSPGLAGGRAIVIEAACGFLVVIAALGAGGAGRDDGFGPRAGLAVGLVLGACAMAFGSLTGGIANPARWLGPALASGTWTEWFVWVIGPVAGGVIAAVLHASVIAPPRPGPIEPPPPP